MTFKDLKKRISLATAIQQQSKLFERLQVVGLPTKEGIEKPLFDYEKLLYDSLLVNDYSNILNHDFKHKHLFVKKSTGLGVTEFFLRLMAWLCVENNDYKNSQMCIVTGPNIDIAIKLIKRMKGCLSESWG